ncbi:carbohydrate ABC transporter permease [Cohnella herbarum]|uniref:Carbohydrate ABC transporter permease n=1 Tax=Cohnella herbarum TaxID=2728023 RepID=A0A7Z2ZPS7_9BACL|nr:carbohydrate ABC transporter permease [Cohnella herbarum]QJD86272.1 carbohydrate ABC transporter permease [Cohnella herbarum]
MRIKQRDFLFQFINSGILIVFAFSCIYPFYYLIINSLSNPADAANGIYLFPKNITLVSYEHLAQIPSIYQSVFISLSRTVVGTVLTVFSCAFVGFLVSKKTMPGRKWIYRSIIFTMFFNSGLIPWYMLMKELHLKNSFLLYVLPSMISAFYIILVKTYIESLPAALEESAEMDGAGLTTVFFKIIMPLSMPIIACVAVFSAVNQWNSWADNYYLVSDSNLNTLQYLLYTNLQTNMANMMNATSGGSSVTSMASSVQVTAASIKQSMTVVTVLPILLVYPLMQRYFVRGLMLGAIKG